MPVKILFVSGSINPNVAAFDAEIRYSVETTGMERVVFDHSTGQGRRGGMKYESTEQVLPFMTPFPDVEDVFDGDIDAHARHLQPLLSVDLDAIDPGWSGKIHFVTPKEPYSGLVGEHTAKFHEYYTRENWIAFRVSGDRYTFMGDFRYFFLEDGEDEEMEEHYHRVEKSLGKTRSFFEKHNILNPWGQTDNPCEWFEEMGGKPGYGNWSDITDFPVEMEEGNDEDGDYVWPLTEDGRRFAYIGCVAGYAYRQGGANGILLFYDPVEKIALITFDWS